MEIGEGGPGTDQRGKVLRLKKGGGGWNIQVGRGSKIKFFDSVMLLDNYF